MFNLRTIVSDDTRDTFPVVLPLICYSVAGRNDLVLTFFFWVAILFYFYSCCRSLILSYTRLRSARQLSVSNAPLILSCSSACSLPRIYLHLHHLTNEESRFAADEVPFQFPLSYASRSSLCDTNSAQNSVNFGGQARMHASSEIPLRSRATKKVRQTSAPNPKGWLQVLAARPFLTCAIIRSNCFAFFQYAQHAQSS